MKKGISGSLAAALLGGLMLTSAARAQLLYATGGGGTSLEYTDETTLPTSISIGTCSLPAGGVNFTGTGGVVNCGNNGFSAQTNLFTTPVSGTAGSLALSLTSGQLFNSLVSLFNGQNLLTLDANIVIAQGGPIYYGAGEVDNVLSNLPAASIGQIDIDYSYSFTTCPINTPSCAATPNVEYLSIDNSIYVCAKAGPCPPVSAPEIDPASAADGFALLGGAIVVLRSRRQKRAKGGTIVM